MHSISSPISAVGDKLGYRYFANSKYILGKIFYLHNIKVKKLLCNLTSYLKVRS